MTRPGRPSKIRETEIAATILSLLPNDSPGRTFKELVEVCKTKGLSKPALWRHLMRFQRTGMAIHEGKYYRRNPLSTVALQSLVRPFRFQVGGSTVRGPTRDFRHLQELRGKERSDYWASPSNGAFDLFDVESMRGVFKSAIEWTTTCYLEMLEIIVHLPSFSAAREAVDLMTDLESGLVLKFFARAFWDSRERVQPKDLNGLEIRFKIETGPQDRPRPKTFTRETRRSG